MSNCDNCGANDWKDSKCTYCHSLHCSMDFVFRNPGYGVTGQWVDGCCVSGEVTPPFVPKPIPKRMPMYRTFYVMGDPRPHVYRVVFY